MPVRPLPDRPSLDRLRTAAKLIRDLVRADDPGALEMVREHHPRLAALSADTPEAARFRLSDAQLTLARHHGFASWPRLKAHVDLVRRLSRSPHRQPVGRALATSGERLDELLRLACLTYGADDPARPAAALALLTTEPALAGASLHAAAATGDVAAARRWIATDPALVGSEGGPFGWVPLLYAAYSRIDDLAAGRDTLGVAGLLLDTGADPDAGYLWEGLPSPFTALTGAFGGGEGDQPPHARSLELAALLLDHGADANDRQTVYNRGLGAAPVDDTEWLELLLDHGLGAGNGGPWKRLLGHEAMGPLQIVAEALHHAAGAGLVGRVRILLGRGVDPDLAGDHPAFGEHSPYDAAVRSGSTETARLLEAAGADTTTGQGAELMGALHRGDAAEVDRLLAADPAALAQLLDAGPERRATHLHELAYSGNGAAVAVLLGLGADPTVTDREHASTPAGWAAHAGHDDLAAVLATAEAAWPQRSGGRSL